MAGSCNRPKRSCPKTDSPDNSTAIHIFKKTKPTKQARMTDWGNMTVPEPENQEPQRMGSDSPLSSLDETSNHADLLSNTNNENINDFIRTAAAREVANMKTCSSTYHDAQPVSNLYSQTSIGNTPIILNLASPPAITNLDFLKYLEYIYSPPTGRPKNRWIWAHGHNIQHITTIQKNGKPQHRWVCRICMYNY